MIAFLRDGRASLCSRRGNDWSDRFPTVVAALEELNLKNAIFDGEIVVLKPDGTSDFQALQNVMRQGDPRRIVFFVFDLLYYGGHDLRQVALIKRKELLSRLLEQGKHSRAIRFGDHLTGKGAQVFAIACRHGLEGIVAKRADSRYVERRTSDWVKIKCLKRQEFVVGGWTEPGGSRSSLGALLLGYHRRPVAPDLLWAGRHWIFPAVARRAP